MSKENVEKYLKDLIVNGDRSTLDSVINLLISVRDFKKGSPQKPVQESARPRLLEKKVQKPEENVPHETIPTYENTAEYAAMLIEGIDPNSKREVKYRPSLIKNNENGLGTLQTTEEQEDALRYADALL